MFIKFNHRMEVGKLHESRPLFVYRYTKFHRQMENLFKIMGIKPKFSGDQAREFCKNHIS